jgi:hypothetical protein
MPPTIHARICVFNTSSPCFQHLRKPRVFGPLRSPPLACEDVLSADWVIFIKFWCTKIMYKVLENHKIFLRMSTYTMDTMITISCLVECLSVSCLFLKIVDTSYAMITQHMYWRYLITFPHRFLSGKLESKLPNEVLKKLYAFGRGQSVYKGFIEGQNVTMILIAKSCSFRKVVVNSSGFGVFLAKSFLR